MVISARGRLNGATEDERFMQLALQAASAAEYATSPNPMVGAVVVKDGEVIAVGSHRRAGDRHAEVEALLSAGERAQGAQLFVTLEPCAHTGRTPACTESIVAAGINRCIVATVDPSRKVSGRGLAALRDAGIDISVGVCEREARRLNEFYIKHALTGLPFATAKLAMSLDGRSATHAGDSQWITAEPARARGHELRRDHDAILVGANTVLRDDPRLTARLEDAGRSPLRVILDSTMRVGVRAKVFDKSVGSVLLATTERARPERVKEFEDEGIPVVVLPARDGQVGIEGVLGYLGRRNILSVLIEGGATVQGSAFDAQLVDKVVAFISPRLIGGAAAPGAVGGRGAAALLAAPELSEVRMERVGPDIVVNGYCCP